MKRQVRFLCVAVLSASAAWAPAATIQVGPTRANTTVAAGYAAASAGDTIEIDSGTYYQSAGWVKVVKANLTFRGVGETRPVLDAGNSNLSGKGIFVIDAGGNNITIDNLELKNARLNAGGGGNSNAAGVRGQGNGLTIRNCYIHDNDDGVLTDVYGSVLIEYTEFNHNGYGDGFTHNMYIGNCPSFTLQYCYTHDTNQGHEVKTRANTNYILYNLISSENGTASRELQLAQGGTCYVIGNVIQQGPNSGNSQIIAYGGEGNNANPYLYIVNNTVVNQRPNGPPAFITKDNSTASGTCLIQNNIFQGFGNETIITGAGGGTNTLVTNFGPKTADNQTADAHLANIGAHDYHLTAASTGVINAGTAPGIGYNSYALTPLYQYIHPYSRETRPTNGTIDIGAYEYVAPNHAPTVSAGADLEVYEGRPVSLHATASDQDNDPLTYAWTQPAGLNVALGGASTADASFTAPTVATLAQAAMTFTVTVSDGKAAPVADSANVRVRILGDINHDDSVNAADLLLLAAAWATTSGSANYNPLCDFNSDAAVDVVDLLTLAGNWARTLN